MMGASRRRNGVCCPFTSPRCYVRHFLQEKPHRLLERKCRRLERIHYFIHYFLPYGMNI